MNIYNIYKATNIVNGKIYIGFTYNIRTRKNSHKCSSFNKNAHDYNLAFHNAIRKYGWNNFKWEIIYQSKDQEHTLKTMENFFIKEYNTYVGNKNHNGYNITLGGEGHSGHIHSKETKAKISNAHKGKKLSDEHKRKVSEGNKGKVISNQTKIKMGAWQKGVFKPIETTLKRCKRYLITWPDKHEEEILGLQIFCRKFGLNQGCMNAVISGIQTHHKGFKCKKLE